jgi:aspartate racemase
LSSFDFAEIEQLQVSGQWEKATRRMIDAAQRLQSAGADLLLICSNTMHKMADQVQAAINVPLLHLADATAKRIAAQGLQRIGLLGTRFTMEEQFYKGRLTSNYGLTVLVPDAEDRRLVNSVIYDELCQGIIAAASKARYVNIMNKLMEITLLVDQRDSIVPLFDTTAIHAEVAVEHALGLGQQQRQEIKG